MSLAKNIPFKLSYPENMRLKTRQSVPTMDQFMDHKFIRRIPTREIEKAIDVEQLLLTANISENHYLRSFWLKARSDVRN